VDCAHRTPKYSPNGIPALRPRDVVHGKLNLDNAARVSESEFQIQTARRVPCAGDVIYSRELSFGWAVETSSARVCMSQGMVLFRPGPGLLVRWFVHLLNNPSVRKQAQAIATGSAHPHLNLKDIRAYELPLPPRAEQEGIATRLDHLLSVFEQAEISVNQQVVRCRAAFRQSILKWAFEGKLVDQDPTDEPATALLDRIKAEREAADTSMKTKKRGRRKARSPKE
jgi:type I restriction enzyme S subunit